MSKQSSKIKQNEEVVRAAHEAGRDWLLRSAFPYPNQSLVKRTPGVIGVEQSRVYLTTPGGA